MLNAKKHTTTSPVLEQRRRRWMSSEASFMRVGTLLLLPYKQTRTHGLGVQAGSRLGVEQLLQVCRKNGLKSKG